MANEFAAPPINNLVSITPLTTPPASRDATGSVPAQLAGVAPGTTVEGFVVNRDGQSNPILRTALGDVLVKSDVFIKTGSEVVFRVDTTQPGHARILTIDGMPPQDYAAANTRGMSGDTVVNATQAAQQAGVAGKVAAAPLTALLVSTTPLPASSIASNPLLAAVAASAAPITPGLLKLAQGAQLSIKLLQVELPVPGEKQQDSKTGVPGTKTPATPPSPADANKNPMQGMANARTAQLAVPDAPQTPAPSLASLVHNPSSPEAALPANLPSATLAAAKAEQARYSLPLPQGSDKIAPGTSPASTVSAAAKQPPAGVAAYVLGHEGDGATILQTPVGTLKTYLPQRLPVGSAVRLDVQPMQTPGSGAGATPVAEAATGITSLAQEWPALADALTLLPASHEAARPLMAAMPEIGPKLTSGLLFFIAAVKTGDLKQWLGSRALAALESRAPSLVERLKGDMAQLQSLLVDSPLQQWNSVMVPMLYQGQLEHARLFFRNDSDGNDGKKKKGEGDQRFIVEVDTSHLGEVQFDGFVRKSSQSKQFDLIVRSTLALPGDLQNQIRTTFENGMNSSGMKGYLAFQQGSQHFVRPMATGNKPSGPQPILA